MIRTSALLVAGLWLLVPGCADPAANANADTTGGAERAEARADDRATVPAESTDGSIRGGLTLTYFTIPG